jgi:hypothetical protein
MRWRRVSEAFEEVQVEEDKQLETTSNTFIQDAPISIGVPANFLDVLLSNLTALCVCVIAFPLSGPIN